MAIDDKLKDAKRELSSEALGKTYTIQVHGVGYEDGKLILHFDGDEIPTNRNGYEVEFRYSPNPVIANKD